MPNLDLSFIIMLFSGGAVIPGLVYFGKYLLLIIKYGIWRKKNSKNHNKVLFQPVIKEADFFLMVNACPDPCEGRKIDYVSYGNDSSEKLFLR